MHHPRREMHWIGEGRGSRHWKPARRDSPGSMSLRNTTGRTAPTEGDEDARGQRMGVPHLFVVLDGDDPRAGSDARPLHKTSVVSIGRGTQRAFRDAKNA